MYDIQRYIETAGYTKAFIMEADDNRFDVNYTILDDDITNVKNVAYIILPMRMNDNSDFYVGETVQTALGRRKSHWNKVLYTINGGDARNSHGGVVNHRWWWDKLVDDAIHTTYVLPAPTIQHRGVSIVDAGIEERAVRQLFNPSWNKR